MAGLGRQKTGGRKPGTPNKSPADFVSRMEELRRRGLDCDPVRVLMEIASSTRLEADGTVAPISPPVDNRDRAKAAAELCSYVFPKRKAVELSQNTDRPIQFSIVPDSAVLKAEVR
jgi:hypothetical protein